MKVIIPDSVALSVVFNGLSHLMLPGRCAVQSEAPSLNIQKIVLKLFENSRRENKRTK